MSAGKEAIEGIYELLSRPDAPFRLDRTEDQLEIIPHGPNTFPVLLADQGKEAVVYACQWHEHFDDPDQAGGCVTGLLSPYYRVVERYQGDAFVKAHIERYEAEGWAQIGSEFGLFNMPNPFRKLMGKKAKLRIYQQAVLRPPFSWVEEFPGCRLDENQLPIGSVLGIHEVPD